MFPDAAGARASGFADGTASTLYIAWLAWETTPWFWLLGWLLLNSLSDGITYVLSGRWLQQPLPHARIPVARNWQIVLQRVAGAVLGRGHRVLPRFSVIIKRIDDAGPVIRARVGIFFKSVIADCSCADDPTPLNDLDGFCELQFDIDKMSAVAAVTLPD